MLAALPTPCAAHPPALSGAVAVHTDAGGTPWSWAAGVPASSSRGGSSMAAAAGGGSGPASDTGELVVVRKIVSAFMLCAFARSTLGHINNYRRGCALDSECGKCNVTVPSSAIVVYTLPPPFRGPPPWSFGHPM